MSTTLQPPAPQLASATFANVPGFEDLTDFKLVDAQRDVPVGWVMLAVFAAVESQVYHVGGGYDRRGEEQLRHVTRHYAVIARRRDDALEEREAQLREAKAEFATIKARLAQGEKSRRELDQELEKTKAEFQTWREDADKRWTTLKEALGRSGQASKEAREEAQRLRQEMKAIRAYYGSRAIDALLNGDSPPVEPAADRGESGKA